MLPAYTANMAPPFVRFWRGPNPAISRRWLGSHKTVLGFTLGVAVAVLTSFVQSRVMWSGSLTEPDSWLDTGLRLGVGALGGDVVKSFVKRRVGIAPGRPWIPLDQLDFAVGALILAAPIARLTVADALVVLAVTFVGDVAVNHVAHALGVRDSAW